MSDTNDTTENATNLAPLETPAMGMAARAAIAQEYTAKVDADTKNATDSHTGKDESSTATDVTAASDTSTAKEEDKKETKEQGEEAEKSPTLVPHEALHQERERRKQAVLENRNLKTRLEELEKRLEEVKKPTASVDTNIEDEDPVIKQMNELREELRTLKEGRKASPEEEAKKAQETLEKTITDLDTKLEAEGFPGFEISAAKTDKVLKRLWEEGEINDTELRDPQMWAQVFKEHVAPALKSKFGITAKEDATKKKVEAKKEASKVAHNSGTRRDDDSEDEKQLTMDDVNSAYFKKLGASRIR